VHQPVRVVVLDTPESHLKLVGLAHGPHLRRQNVAERGVSFS
jgi:hypothetical protein